MTSVIKNLTVIIQAGGRGSRLRHHTWNKPKCLVSVRGKPILYHAFEYFQGADFILIGDYLFDQLEKYLTMNPPAVNYKLVRAVGEGTASGIKEAICNLSPDNPVLLLWSDLIVHSLPDYSAATKAVVFTTSAFPCRWSLTDDGKMDEKTSASRGLPGIFYFPHQKLLDGIPLQGEFVKWYAASKSDFISMQSDDLEELGDFVTIEKDNDRAGFCRFFNNVEVGNLTVIKRVVDQKFSAVHENEKAWYKEAQNLGFRRIPKIYGYAPLEMQRLEGQHLFQIKDLSLREQRAVFADYIDSLQELHDRIRVPARSSELSEVYIEKTISRIESVLHIIPNMQKSHMTVNGKKCRNFYHEKHRDFFSEIISKITPEYFCAIHGDPTFSNTLVDEKLRVWYIDPRGSFAKPGIVGDGWYDFAKLYYSAIGAYDAFNRKKFKLHIDSDTVEVLLERPIYADTANSTLKDYFNNDLYRIEIIHGLIWLSLSGYVKDDIDSIIGAYYYGNFWLESAMERL